MVNIKLKPTKRVNQRRAAFAYLESWARSEAEYAVTEIVPSLGKFKLRCTFGTAIESDAFWEYAHNHRIHLGVSRQERTVIIYEP